MPDLPISEVFGPVYQGEGPHTGRRCSFVRLGLCNLRCSWCDTPYTWDNTRYDVDAECPPTEWKTVRDKVLGHRTELLILTGGEPLIHQANPNLQHLLSALTHEVHVETNGTLPPTEWMLNRVRHWSVSPKLANGGDAKHRRLRPVALHAFAVQANKGKAVFKFVAQHPDDLAEVDSLTAEYRIPPWAVWVMPEGRDTTTLLDTAHRLEPAITVRGWNMSLRQQILVHGDKKGT